MFPYLCGFRSIHSCSGNGNGRDALNTANCLGIRGILRSTRYCVGSECKSSLCVEGEAIEGWCALEEESAFR